MEDHTSLPSVQTHKQSVHLDPTLSRDANIFQGRSDIVNSDSVDHQVNLIIKIISGQQVSMSFSDEVKSLNIAALKVRAFPQEHSKGYAIRLIYRGRLLKDNECLSDLEFVGDPVIHAQLNPPSHVRDVEN